MKHVLTAAATAITLAHPASAQEAEVPVTPSSVVANASLEEWTTIAAEDLLVMELAPDARGNARTVVIQLMPPPFSQPWVENIRTLASAHWWDGTSVYRVQDNYVTQWGDFTEEKALPEGVVSPLPDVTVGWATLSGDAIITNWVNSEIMPTTWTGQGAHDFEQTYGPARQTWIDRHGRRTGIAADYTNAHGFHAGFPFGLGFPPDVSFRVAPSQPMIGWPIHCYGYIGVARDYAPDTGTGAELYTIIGQPQRHMDRNLAVVGRVIEGMEHLSSLPRGSGDLGFYTDEEAGLRTQIVSVRLGSELPEAPAFEYLDTSSESFASYVAVRANRNDPFYTVPAGGVDVCNVQVPVRRVAD